MRTLYLIVVCWAVLIIGGCKEYEKHYTNEKLIDVLMDLKFAESAAERIPLTIRDSVQTHYEEVVFDIHGVNRMYIEEDIAYLERNPGLYTTINDSVLVRMERMRDSLMLN